MSDLKRKAESKTDSSLRTPKPKKKLGLSVPAPLKMPHEELIISPNIFSNSSMTSHTSQTGLTSMTSHRGIQPPIEQLIQLNKTNKEDEVIIDLASSMTSQTSHTKEKPLETPTQTGSMTSLTSHTQPVLTSKTIAPVKDFTRVANSITRDAVPEGLFRGKSKLLYDYLYSQTRGAIVPTFTIRISRPKLMAAAGIGSRVTFDTNVEHLIKVGLVEVRSIVGEHNGNEYTVYLPEERFLPAESMPSQTSQTSMTGYAQKLDRLVRLETRQTRHTSSTDLSNTYDVSNTLLIHDDDDIHTHMRNFYDPLIETAAEITGVRVKVSPKEIALWKECGEILAEELRDAAQNTKNISSVPAFFAEHLRRQFKKKSKSQKPATQVSDLQETKDHQNESLQTSITKPATKSVLGDESNSKFTLEQCRLFAEHLQETRQGIINPGGYATVIFRSGEADELIEDFLNKESQKSERQTLMGEIEVLRKLHLEDSSYQSTDLKEDLRYRCERKGIAWNEEMVNALLASQE